MLRSLKKLTILN